MFLLDTNACLDFLLLRNRDVLRRIDENFTALSVSTITVAELRVGSKATSDPKSEDRKLDEFLASMSVVSFSAEAAAQYGEIIRAVGMDRRSFDRLIAAHAVSLNRCLVTNNERDFADIPGLRVENWAAA